MKWIKNTEMKPKKDDDYYIFAPTRDGNGNYLWEGLGTKTIFIFREGNWYFDDDEGMSGYEEMVRSSYGEFMWLDESAE